jgi:hypothetical protein
MKNILKITAAVALMLSSSVAMAQNGSDVTGGNVSVTVSSVFVPGLGNQLYAIGGGATVSPQTPVSISTQNNSWLGWAEPAAVGVVTAVTGGNAASTASFTSALVAGNIPQGVSAEIASALQALGSQPTAGSVATAVSAWNAAVSKLTGDQLFSLMITPAGRAAINYMAAAQEIASGNNRFF